jgi:lysozyme family protein
MASFNTFAQVKIITEGFFARLQNDTGGMTFIGIARNFHPTWRGWSIIDRQLASISHLSDRQISAYLKDIPDLRQAVNEFYRPWWNRIGAQHLSQDLANLYMDFYLHKPAPAVRTMQVVLNANFNTKLAIDGTPGPNTNAAVKKHDTPKLYNAYRAARIQWYKDQKYSSPTFWQAWVNRVTQNFPAKTVAAGGLLLLATLGITFKLIST